jgi:Arc/MetJ-type ribon-helix-helix transcriptional regulator
MRSEQTMSRTQIYLSAQQQAALAQLAQERQLPKSELIRQALDRWLAQEQKPAMSKLEALRKLRGMWKDRTDMDDPVAYVNELRQGGQRQAMLEKAWGRDS